MRIYIVFLVDHCFYTQLMNGIGKTPTRKIPTNQTPPGESPPPGKFLPRKFPPGIFPPMFLNMPTRVFLIFCFLIIVTVIIDIT